MNRKLQIPIISIKYTIPCIMAVAVLMAGCKKKDEGINFLAMAGILSMKKTIPGGSPVSPGHA